MRLSKERMRRKLVVCGQCRGWNTKVSRSRNKSLLRKAKVQDRGSAKVEPSISVNHSPVIRQSRGVWIEGAWITTTIAGVMGLIIGARLFSYAPLYSESRSARDRKKFDEQQRFREKLFNSRISELSGESVEWLNMALRKVWRVYMQQIEQWMQVRLQRAIDRAVLKRKIKQSTQNADGVYTLLNLTKVNVAELKLDYEPPVLRAIESRKESRKDSEIGAIANFRYTGGLRALFLIELSFSMNVAHEDEEQAKAFYDMRSALDKYNAGVVTALTPTSVNNPWHISIPVQVYDLDVESDLSLKVKMAPLPPYVGGLSLAFVDPPAIGVQLAPYKRAQLMRIPMVQSFLTKLITEDLPNLMVLPRRLEFDIPPSLTAVAGAAIGQDNVRRAILNAVINAEDSNTNQRQKSKGKKGNGKKKVSEKRRSNNRPKVEVITTQTDGSGSRTLDLTNSIDDEHLSVLAKPWTQGGITLPKNFEGELLVTLHCAKGLVLWTGIPGIAIVSSPYCQLRLGSQTASSRKFRYKNKSKHSLQRQKLDAPLKNHQSSFDPWIDSINSIPGMSVLAEPVWNQDFQFLVQDSSRDELIIEVKDSHLTGKPEIGHATLRISDLESGVPTQFWLELQPPLDAPGIATSGEILVEATYRNFINEEIDVRSIQSPEKSSQELLSPIEADITDIRSAAAASAKAGILSSMTASAIAATKATSMRAAVALSEFRKNRMDMEEEEEMDEEGMESEGKESVALVEQNQISSLNSWDAIKDGDISDAYVQNMVYQLKDRLEKDERTKERQAQRWLAQSDRPWFQLVSFLLGVVIMLLVVIAYKVNLMIYLGG